MTQNGQFLDFVKIGEKSMILVPDSVKEKLEAKKGDAIAFYYKDGHVILKRGAII